MEGSNFPNIGLALFTLAEDVEHLFASKAAWTVGGWIGIFGVES